jgi:chitinase
MIAKAIDSTYYFGPMINRYTQTFSFIVLLMALFSMSGCLSATTTHGINASDRDHIITGYWHNWQGQSTGWLPLEKIPEGYNRVIVSFALPSDPWTGEMTFSPDLGTTNEFKVAIQKLQERGTQVLVAIGGGRHPIEIQTEQQRDRFIQSIHQIIETYNFDGIDVNLEGKSLVLDEDDRDFRNPSTSKVLHLIQALREIKQIQGSSFLLTFAPETVYSVGGYNKYGGGFGGYLPVFHALTNELDAVHLQLYNSGSQYVFHGQTNDNPVVEQGNMEFVTDLTQMLAEGFPVARDTSAFFPGIGYDKVFPGLPAHPDAAPGGGYIEPALLCQALQEIGSQAEQRNESLPGVMFWSINWDSLQRTNGTSYLMLKSIQNCLAP